MRLIDGDALKEIAQLACESVERDKAFARLESEVEAVIKATKKE